MRKNPATLRTHAAELLERAEHASHISAHAADYAPGSYVTGASGRTRAMNRKTDRALDKTIKYAKITISLRKKAASLEMQARYIEETPARIEREASARERAKIAKKNAPKKTYSERLFIGCYPCGWVYADNGREEHGDYKDLAFMSYKTLVLELCKDCPPEFAEIIKADAEKMQAMRGQEYRIAMNATVILGE